MKKQLGILATLVFLSVTTLLWTGCSRSNNYDDCCQPVCEEPCKPVCPEPCKPVCPPPCVPKCPPPCAPECKPVCPPPCKPVCPPPCPRPCEPECKPVCPPPCPKPCVPECRPVCPPPCAPPCAAPCEPCPPKCAAPLKACKYGPSGECGCNGVSVRARNPGMCMLGSQYPLEFDISACIDVCDVTITTTLPEGVSFIRSCPEAKVEGRKLTWEIGHMSKGQTINAKVFLKCEREGDLCTCFCVKATPVAFCALLCAQPVLVCEKCAPAEVCPGDSIHYGISVTNIGTCTAEDVVITDMLPEGVESANGCRTLTFKLGCLEACQTKKVNFCATACKRGKVCNKAIVTACNANQTSCEACTCICCCQLECQKTGPKEVSVGQNADYQITVVNTGDKVVHEVVVTDTAPSATSIVKAQGANICGKQAVWKLKEIKPGERVTFNITLTTCTPGYFVNRANMTSCEGCTGSCEVGTNWKGRPALDICVDINDNPICVGETTRLKINVSNKGQEYDSNVKVVVNLPAGLVPVNTGGATAGTISGQTVTFAPVANLAPHQTTEFYITVRGDTSGDLRPEVQVSSDFIKNPIRQQESLIVN